MNRVNVVHDYCTVYTDTIMTTPTQKKILAASHYFKGTPGEINLKLRDQISSGKQKFCKPVLAYIHIYTICNWPTYSRVF